MNSDIIIAQRALDQAMLAYNSRRISNPVVVDAFMKADEALKVAERQMDDTTIAEDDRMEAYGVVRIAYMNARMEYMCVMGTTVADVKSAQDNLAVAQQNSAQ